MSDATFTFRVSGDLKSAFAQAAKSMDRSGAQLLRDFMRDVVRGQNLTETSDVRLRQQIQVGLDAANAGEVVSADDVEADAAAWRAEIGQMIHERQK